MNIIVCLKQILDPEIPVRDFRVDGEKKEVVRGAANLVTNIFCENALETALQLREKLSGGKINALSFGAESAEDTLRKATPGNGRPRWSSACVTFRAPCSARSRRLRFAISV